MFALHCSAAASSSGGGDLGSAELDLLTKLLRWPAFVLYPALDIARMAVLHEPTAARLAESAGPLQLSPLGEVILLLLLVLPFELPRPSCLESSSPLFCHWWVRKLMGSRCSSMQDFLYVP